ncbi:MAG: 6-carboxytetrahydropterin synthase [Bacteroidales bacterium]|nr:6-carboxytetrahydropterin synthase [Porphyromonas sp.]MDD6935267.1 6-carboxytetrahydropterin synthase [Bacteroidales bacterium]MDY3102877.1 6-carboxytetrahydropterin synthase [Porphyromonas sp.]
MMEKTTQLGLLTAERYHDISMGHRVVGHEHKCRHLHGHNYRIHFRCSAPELDSLGRVIDFGVIKERLCLWLEEQWDHRMMLWQEDPILPQLQALVAADLVIVPFNPTAESMARYLVEVVAPRELEGTGVTLVACTVEETSKCSASYRLIP